MEMETRRTSRAHVIAPITNSLLCYVQLQPHDISCVQRESKLGPLRLDYLIWYNVRHPARLPICENVCLYVLPIFWIKAGELPVRNRNYSAILHQCFAWISKRYA